MSVTDEALPDVELFRRAVHGLYLMSLEDTFLDLLRGQDRLGDAILSVPEAAAALARAPVHRLLKLHAVASALSRKPALLLDGTENREALAVAVADDEHSVGDMTAGLERFAQRVGDQPGPLSPARWDQFLEDISDNRTELAVVNKPGCNDDEAVPMLDGSARTIKSRFWTDLSVADLAKFVDPKRWAVCGKPFWRQMDPVAGTEVPFRRAAVEGYTAVFKERVNLPVGEVTVYLHVEYGLETHSGELPTHVYANYQLAIPATTYPIGAVTFDSGWLCATANTLGPGGEGTLVEGLKAIRFADPALNEFPDLACDGGWVYLMINMALQCSGVPTGGVAPSEFAPTEVAPPGGVVGAVTAIGGIEDVINDWIRTASESVQSHGEDAKSAIGKVLGERYDPHWVNDALNMGQGAVTTTKATLNAWRRILEELADLGGER
jgi:hypothetical protein